MLGVVAVGLAFVQPYALVFVLPSLYAWLWLPLDGRLVVARASSSASGSSGRCDRAPSSSGRQLGLSVLDAALYVIGLITVGYLPLGSALLGLAWAAAATQIGALAFGRYAPYAGGLEPPPAGPIRRALVARATLVEREEADEAPAAISPSPRGTCTSASAAAARAIMCDSWPEIGSSRMASAVVHAPRAHELVALRIPTEASSTITP